MNDDLDIWWRASRRELQLLVERLTPEDALEVVRELVKHESESDAIAYAAGMLRGLVRRRDDEQRRRRAGMMK